MLSRFVVVAIVAFFAAGCSAASVGESPDRAQNPSAQTLPTATASPSTSVSALPAPVVRTYVVINVPKLHTL
jgi:hypothetical protein